MQLDKVLGTEPDSRRLYLDQIKWSHQNHNIVIFIDDQNNFFQREQTNCLAPLQLHTWDPIWLMIWADRSTLANM